MKSMKTALVAFLLLAGLPEANAQSVSGDISGSVIDPAGAVVAGWRIRDPCCRYWERERMGQGQRYRALSQ